jgi:hypothetical protein
MHTTDGYTAHAQGLIFSNEVPVAILHWPAESYRDAALARQGRLRLFLVAPTAAPPAGWDPLADWIRMPASELDVWHRVAGLQRRLDEPPEPCLDEFGVLWRGPDWVSLAPAEARLVAVLLERPGIVCSRQSLARGVWPNAPLNDNLLNAYVKRVRRKVAPLAVAIRTVRQRGYFLESDPHPATMPARRGVRADSPPL